MAKLYTPNTWTDELLAGAERYDIKQNDGTPINANAQINLITAVAVAGTSVTAARMNNLEGGLDALDSKVSTMETRLHDATDKGSVVDADETQIADSANSFSLKKITFASIKTWAQAWLTTWIPTTFKDVSGKLAGLTAFKINIRNTADTFTSFFISNDTAARNYTLANRNATLGNWITNFSTFGQSFTAATRTYVDGSQIAIPADGLKVGTTIIWMIDLTKTAAGIAASTFDICFGTTGTVSDTARISFIKPAGTAAIDNGRVVIEMVVRSIAGGGTANAVGHFNMSHNLATTGHLIIGSCNLVTVSAGFDMTLANCSYVGVCLTTGAADAITAQMCVAEAKNL